MTFKTKIPADFVDAASNWLTRSGIHGISSRVWLETHEFCTEDEYEEWLHCTDNETLCYFDLLVGAAQP